MAGRILLKLENDNHPLLGPNLWGLKVSGLWQQNGFNPKLCNAVHVTAIIFVISQYVELWCIRAQLDLALRNLSITILSSICVVKAGTFVIWQKQWKSIIEYVSAEERSQLSKKDKVTNAKINEYTKYSRIVTCFYWTLVLTTVIAVILAPLASFWSSLESRERIRNGSAPYPEIMSSWVPFDRTRGPGYWISVIEHSLICVYGGSVVATYDSNVLVLMTFFTGQLKILRENCSRLFDETNSSYDEDMDKVRECHSHHKALIRHSKNLNRLLSPVMFLYVIICSLMLCASGVQLTMAGLTNMQRIWIAEYLMALIAQLFLYCWHSNNVLDMSLIVDSGVYSSSWWSRDVRVRRSALLLAGQLKKKIVFTAGPFTNLTLSTFVAILKGSYSYFALLSSTEDN